MLGLAIQITGVPGGAGARNEQGIWLGCVGKGEAVSSKPLVIFLLFKFEAVLRANLAALLQ